MGGSGAQWSTAPWIVGWVSLLLSPVLVGCLLFAALGCVHGRLVETDDGFRDRTHGFGIGHPPERDPPWTRIQVPEADLAYRRGDHVLMSVRTSCGRPQAPARILARHLRIGLGRHVVRSEGEVVHRGVRGWRQTFDAGGARGASGASGAGGAVRVSSVTLVDRGCTIDFLLTGQSRFDQMAPDFDLWWQRYEPMPDPEVAP